MANLSDRIARGEVIILDGAMGTELQRRGVPMDRVAWSAAALETHPDIIRDIHEDYVRAGADVIITNSFGASRHVLEPAGLGSKVAMLNRRSVDLAKQARDRSGQGRDIAIAGSISSWIAEGETRNTPTPAVARASYGEQAALLADAGADLLVLEMMRDIEHSCICIEAARATGLPVWVGFTCTLARDGKTVTLRNRDREMTFADSFDATMAAGGSLVAVMHSDLDATDPSLDIVFEKWSGPVAVYPHSGDWTPPNWIFSDVIAPDAFVRLAQGWVGRGVQVVGGCCGLGPEHIRQLAVALSGRRIADRG